MKVYRTDEIRNVVLLGHGGSGKTSLAEAMAYVSGEEEGTKPRKVLMSMEQFEQYIEESV